MGNKNVWQRALVSVTCGEDGKPKDTFGRCVISHETSGREWNGTIWNRRKQVRPWQLWWTLGRNRRGTTSHFMYVHRHRASELRHIPLFWLLLLFATNLRCTAMNVKNSTDTQNLTTQPCRLRMAFETNQSTFQVLNIYSYRAERCTMRCRKEFIINKRGATGVGKCESKNFICHGNCCYEKKTEIFHATFQSRF